MDQERQQGTATSPSASRLETRRSRISPALSFFHPALAVAPAAASMEAASHAVAEAAAYAVAEGSDMGDTHVVGETATPKTGDIYAAVGETVTSDMGDTYAAETHAVMSDGPLGAYARVAEAVYPGAAAGVFFAHLTRPCQASPEGLHIILFEARSAFTRVAACTLTRLPIRDPLSEGFRQFVASMPAPIASGWSESPGGTCTHGKAPPCYGTHQADLA